MNGVRSDRSPRPTNRSYSILGGAQPGSDIVISLGDARSSQQWCS